MNCSLGIDLVQAFIYGFLGGGTLAIVGMILVMQSMLRRQADRYETLIKEIGYAKAQR